MITVFEELRLAGKLCDAVIRVQDVEFQVHKIILCNCSSYFRALFLRWSRLSQNVYVIKDITPTIMELIIKFVYTGSLPVTMDNVQDLMVKADKYDIAPMVQTCGNFLEEQLCSENCIGIWQFTRNYFFPALHLKIYRYILNHFQKVVCDQQLLQLTVEEFANFLSKDELIVRTESCLFEGILRWVAYDQNKRKEHLYHLLSQIRLCLMSEAYLTVNVLSNDLVKSDPQCLEMVNKAAKILHYISKNSNSNHYSNPYVRPRKPYEIMLATGGFSGREPINNIEVYDARVNRWINLTPLAEHPRGYHGTAFLNGYIYYIGGFDRTEIFSSVRRFDPVTRVFQEVSSMHSRRSYVSVTVLNGFIYALGGYDGQVRLKSAEYYQPQSNQWSLIGDMHASRSDASCTILHGKIYIFGGFNGWECLQTAEFYDPDTNLWTLIADMSIRRSGVSAIGFQNLGYVAGGFDGENRLNSAEVYDPGSNTWTLLPSMMTKRSNFGIEILDDCIFAVGGFDGISTTQSVETFDPLQNMWCEAPCMSIPRSALSCCVVYGLPNMEDYTVNRDSLPTLDLDQEGQMGEDEEVETEEETEEEDYGEEEEVDNDEYDEEDEEEGPESEELPQ
ncbi:unnamed protein product [Ophioblennius macclurei]